MILGIDEAGRGPWAGPLAVGTVVLGGEVIDGLTDSKKLSKKRREELYDEINAKAKAVGLGWVDSAELDEVGMSQALRLATRRAVKSINTSYHEIIIDGTVNFLVDTPLESYVTTLAKADLLIPSVSAASIIAKVSRDRFMAEQDKLYPGYGFSSHSGYGTAKHRAAIDKLGVTPLHRLSFAPLAKYADSKTAVIRARNGYAQSATKVPTPGQTRAADVSPAESPSSPASSTTRQIGDSSELVASQELVRRGHEIIARNWKTKYCEIDIISQKSDVIYFTEVKHRRNSKAGDGLAAITAKKLNQMRFAAKFYAHTQKINDSDLRLIAIATAGDKPEVTSLTLID